VLAEIDTYANWPALANNENLRVDGIFFDETPSEYASESYEYLKIGSEAVRDSAKFQDQYVGEYLIVVLHIISFLLFEMKTPANFRQFTIPETC
jgi:hypothetical protein